MSRLADLMHPGPGEPHLRGHYVAAHRGARTWAPENTLAAFSAALSKGAKALELDVHLTSDGRVVVIHDALVDRTTDGSGLVGNFSSDDIKRLDAGSWFSPQFAGETVPFLGEVLELTEGEAVLHVELKGRPGYLLAAEVVKVVRAAEAVDRVILMSFDLDSALAARRAGPEFTVLPIVGAPLEDQLGFVRSTGLSGLNQNADYWAQGTVERFHELGLIVHGSLINDVGKLNEFFARGGDMADSDSPDCFVPAEAPR